MDGDDALHESSGEETGTGTGTEDASEEEQSWISWFCSIRGNEFFCEVDEEYIHDEFNLTGLAQEVPYFDYALDTILDVDSPNADLLTEEQQETVDAAAELLYGLIHARYILTSKGLHAMYDKFNDVHFGRCSRVYCEGQAMLPVGQSDLPRKSTVALYCPRCNDVYYPKSSRHANIDGAYFGTTFPHLFLMTFPAAVPPPPALVYVPRVFGFRVRMEPVATDAPSSGGAPAAAAAAPGDSQASGFVGVRALGPAGVPVPVARAAASRSATTRMGRTREIAVVLSPEAVAARRRAGQDDFMDDDEMEDDGAAGEPNEPSGNAAPQGWGGAASAAPAHRVHGVRVASGRASSSHAEAGMGDEEDDDDAADNDGDAEPGRSGHGEGGSALDARAVTAAVERLALSSSGPRKRQQVNGVDGIRQ